MCSCVFQVLRKLSKLLQTSQQLSVIILDRHHNRFGKNCRDHSCVHTHIYMLVVLIFVGKCLDVDSSDDGF